MRSGTTPELQAALDATGIQTAICASLEFASETVNVWTGSYAFAPTATGDSKLDGKTFQPLDHGVVLSMSDNSYTMTGSEAFKMSLAIPVAPSTAVSAAIVIPAEFQGRLATIWRAILLTPPGPGTPPTWLLRRIRVGAMDFVEVSNDGLQHTFTLSIEGHASLISNATGSTYMDQPRFDAQDTSQQFVKNCANGDPGPMKGGYGGAGGGGTTNLGQTGRLLLK